MIAFHVSPFIVLIELVASIGVLLLWQEKRPLFALRVLLFAVILIGMNFTWDKFVFENLAYVIQFAVIVLAVLFCYNLNPVSALYWSTASLSIQHLAFSLLTLSSCFFYGIYSTPIYFILCYIIILTLEYLLITRHFGKDFELRDKQIKLTIVSLIAMFSCTILNSYRMRYTNDNDLIFVTSIYSIICSLLALFLQLGLFEKGQLEMEKSVLEQIIANDKRHYDDSLQNVELLNMYCHDLKYFLRRNADEVGSFKHQAEKFLSTFDADISTYNHALDTILTEKSLYCANNDIQLTCMADGQLLEYMDTADVYAMFGNLLSNAIEAVSKLENHEKRMISLTVRRRNDFVHILVDNYYDNTLSFHNGLPESTKEQPHLHGYGLKSIRYLAEKYNGNLTISADEDVFHVNILMPINIQ
ncbi:GHKL domain-containing protein [Pseudobutyrivibrio sp. ACV-2]|uniref:ATP-binding protein n=1 Tax=Pseudobutyrivibrio sp. ACV-2 TaxID=1520801 RepID=UPI0008956DA1|nr:ATP-binding protein [Pseudobutyrivibrio sp. ACV-2]SEA42273.1 GHKL domain-containing protein [Pseudobutyrivibrio sp. ACV-2]